MGTCTADCNGGQRTPTRQCNQPAPECNETPCDGPSSLSESCESMTCTDGKVLSNCSNSCDTSCSTLTCNGQCSEAELCQIGCVCANITIIDANRNCITPSTCQYTYEGRTFLPEQIINVVDKCQECTCQNSCITCKSIPCIEQCTFSDWSSFEKCSAPCNEDPLFTYTYAPSIDGSCVKVPKPEICSVNQLPADFITIDDCVSTHMIPQQQCLGGCISYSMSGFNSPRNNCRCYSPASTSTIQVEMRCTDSNGDTTIISKPYENILTCSCSTCGSTIDDE